MNPHINNLDEINGVSIHSGFPNAAADQPRISTKLSLDINRLLIKHPSSTFLFRIAGHSWADQGIFDGDIAVVDRAVSPRDNDLIISWVDDFIIERCHHRPPNDQVWGVITVIIHRYEHS